MQQSLVEIIHRYQLFTLIHYVDVNWSKAQGRSRLSMRVEYSQTQGSGGLHADGIVLVYLHKIIPVFTLSGKSEKKLLQPEPLFLVYMCTKSRSSRPRSCIKIAASVGRDERERT